MPGAANFLGSEEKTLLGQMDSGDLLKSKNENRVPLFRQALQFEIVE